MKKLILLSALACLYAGAAAAGAAYLTRGKPAEKCGKAGCCYSAPEGSAVNVMPATGLKIRSDEKTEFCMDASKITVKKGRIWVSALEKPAEISVPGFSLRDARGVFSADAAAKKITVLSGMGFIYSKKQGKKVVTGGNTASPSGVLPWLAENETSGWFRNNMEMDRDKAVFVFEQGDYLVKAAEQAINAGIARRYFVDPYFEIPQDTNDYIEIRMKAEKKGTGTSVSGVVTEKMSGKVIGIIEQDKDQQAKMAPSVNMSFLKAGRQAAAIIERYSEEKAAKTSVVIVQADIKDEASAAVVENMLSAVDGCKILDKKIFLNNKAVFTVDYPGTGYELALSLSDKQINKNPINVWKSSKNIVKLK